MAVDLREGGMNVFDLTIPEERRNVATFDLETDITENDWDNMIDLLKESIFYGGGLSLARKIYLLSPNRIKGLLESIQLEDIVKQFPSIDSQDLKLLRAEEIRILFPESFRSLNMDPGAWRDFMESFEEPNNLFNSFDTASMACVVFPHAREEIANLVPEEYLRFFWKSPNMTPEEHLAEARIISEKWFRELMKELPKNFWEESRRLLEEYRQESGWERFTTEALSMKIISAKSITPTEEGLEIVMPETEVSGKELKLPKVRSF